MASPSTKLGTMGKIAQILATCAASVLIGASSLDTAYIIGNSNGRAWQIAVRSDGAATLYSASGARSFALPADTVNRFFKFIIAVHDDDWIDFSCPTSDPRIESRIHVQYHGWASVDISCWPYFRSPNESEMVSWHFSKLNNVVSELQVLAGYPAAFKCTELPDWRPPGCK
jgi:hypothetical protein